METILQFALRILVLLASRHRTLGIRDWVASVLCITTLAVATLYQIAGQIILTGKDFTWQASLNFVLLSAIVFMVTLVPTLFILKLRRNGITDADFSVEGGIDYISALKVGRGGFRFMGVGAAKLTQNDNEFREAVKSARKSQSKIELLLLDPSSEVLSVLERNDSAQGYRTTIENSIKFIVAITGESHDVVSLKTYRAKGPDQLHPFRLFFAEGDCLVSPFVSGTGTPDRGRLLPQLRISSDGWPKKNAPTLYVAFDQLFKARWTQAPDHERR